jgi:peptidoglycan-associated lipoprotein
MKTKTVGWVIGSLGLLLGAGTARAQDSQPGQPSTGGQETTTSGQVAGQMAGDKPVCRDAGVTVSFTTGSYELDQNAKGALNGVATWMKNDMSRTLHLQGYADTTGDTDANFVLSEHRAESVKDYLVSQGIEATRIMTVGRGEHLDHLPANGRTVTFLACQPQQGQPGAPVGQGEAETEKPAEAQAQAEPPAPLEVVPPPPPAPEAYPVPAATPVPWGSRFGWAFMAGGAYSDFTQTDMRNRTNAGGAWDARVIGGVNSVVGFEAAYIGSANTIQTLGLTANTPALVSNGVEGTLRVNAPFHTGESLLEPYGFVGLGWSHYNINNYNSNFGTVSDFSQSDNIMDVPIGGGFAYGYRAFMIDARASWTPTYYNNLLINSNGTGTLNRWGVGGQIGFKF